MRPFSSGPDGDHPAGEIDGSVLIEPTIHLSTIQKVLDLTTQNSTPILGLAEKFEYLSEPNISPVLYALNSSWFKESAIRVYFTIRLGKQLARIHCNCK